jgi:MraZ protein
MSMLRGNAPTTVDPKGRLKLPAAFRAAITDTWGSDFSDFFVTSMNGESALIYPLPVWQEIEDRLNELPFFDPTKKKLLDCINYYGQVTSIDTSSRILIPQKLREEAQIAGEVAVLGCLKYLEVWNDKRISSRIKEQRMETSELETLSKAMKV